MTRDEIIRQMRADHARRSHMSILDAAIEYVGRGWPIFPIRLATKHPAILTGKDHAEHATKSRTQLRTWHRAGLLAAIGMPCGAASGTVVIDVDTKHDGEPKLAELEDALCSLPRDRVSATRHGGFQIYLAHPGGGIRVRTGAGARSPLGRLLCGAAGVDVRADGGIVVLPPTRGTDGGKPWSYTWISDGPLPPLPALWLAAIQGDGDPQPQPPPRRTTIAHGSDDRTRRASQYLAAMPPAISGEQGHSALFEATTAVMIGFDLDAATTKRLLLDEYNWRCVPPWSEKEIDHKIEQVATRSTHERDIGRCYLLARSRDW